MHATTTLLALLAAATTTLAAPAPAPAPPTPESISTRGAARPWWTIRDYRRTCAGPLGAETRCTTTFGIDTWLGLPGEVRPIHLCTIKTTGNAQNPATHASFSDVPCGPNGRFTLSAGWSGQFGDGNGFTTTAIVDKQDRVVIYAGYADWEIPGDGSAVWPNKEFEPHNL